MKIPKKLKTVLLLLGAAAVLAAAVKYALPVLVSLAAALALEAPVRFLCRRLRLSRELASGICVICLAALLLGGLFAAGERLLREARGLCVRLPELAASAGELIGSWRAHPGAEAFGGVLDALESALSALPARLSGVLISRLPDAAAATPSALLSAATAVIGTYFSSSSMPELRRFIAAQLPEACAERLRAAVPGLRSVLAGWLRAQLGMLGATFLALALAFRLLRVDYWLTLAAATALIDALPVLGTGTVLLPWAAYELLTGSSALAAGLAVTYGAVTVLRSCLQPKLLGGALGLHPLVSLAAIYVGFRLWGVGGMIALPIAAICLCRLNDTGIIRLWKTPDREGKCTNDGNNIQYNCRSRDERAGRDEYAPR